MTLYTQLYIYSQRALPGQNKSEAGFIFVDEVADEHEKNAEGKRNNPESEKTKVPNMYPQKMCKMHSANTL